MALVCLVRAGGVIFDCNAATQFDPNLYAVSETNGSVTVFVQRTDGDATPITVSYSTRDGSARAGVDYAGQSGTLTLGAGPTTNVITIPVFANRTSLVSRTFYVDLSNASPEGSVGANATALVKILDEAQPGSVDSGFRFEPTNNISVVAVEPDGKVLVGLNLLWDRQQPLGRLNQNGSWDESFHPEIVLIWWSWPQSTTALLLRPNGEIEWAGFGAGGDVPVGFVRGLDRDGHSPTNCPAFGSLGSFAFESLCLTPDGDVLAGAASIFSPRPGALLRMNAGCSRDYSFTAPTDGRILAEAVGKDGKIVIGGAFTDVNGTNRNRLAQLGHDGSLDLGFFSPGTNNGCDSIVHRLAVQQDGKIIVAGEFSRIQGEPHPFLARLNPDGTVDGSFPSDVPNASLFALAMQMDGKILIGGTFTEVGAFSRPRIARLLADGSVDETFDPGTGPNGLVANLALFPDGDILIFGEFTEVNGVARKRLARLHGYQLRLEPPVRLPDENVLLRVRGQTWARANIDVSDDLVGWSTLGTSVLTNTVVDFLDTNAVSRAHRFYRVSGN